MALWYTYYTCPTRALLPGVTLAPPWLGKHRSHMVVMLVRPPWRLPGPYSRLKGSTHTTLCSTPVRSLVVLLTQLQGVIDHTCVRDTHTHTPTHTLLPTPTPASDQSKDIPAWSLFAVCTAYALLRDTHMNLRVSW